MGFGCPICSEKLDKLPAEAQDRRVPDINVSATPCGHMFHSYCIQKWLTGNLASSKQCPCCRKEVPKLRCLALFPTSFDDSILDDSFSTTAQCNHGEIINSLKIQTDRQLKEIEENKRLYELLSEDYTTVNDKYRDEKMQSDMWMIRAKSLESFKDQAERNEDKAKYLEQELKKYKLIESMVKDVKEVTKDDAKDFPPTPQSIQTLLEMKHVLSGELRLTSKKLADANQNYEKLRSEKLKLKIQHDKTCSEFKELRQIYEISRLNGRIPATSPAPTSGPSRSFEGSTPKAFRFSKRRFHEPNQGSSHTVNSPDVDSEVDVFPVPTKLKKHKGIQPKAPTKVTSNTLANQPAIPPASSSSIQPKSGPSSSLGTARGLQCHNRTIILSSDDDNSVNNIVIDSDSDDDDDFRIKGNVPGAPLPIRGGLARNLQRKAEKPSLGLGRNFARRK